MQLTYILISLSYLTFITATEFAFDYEDLYTSQIWEVNLYLDEEVSTHFRNIQRV